MFIPKGHSKLMNSFVSHGKTVYSQVPNTCVLFSNTLTLTQTQAHNESLPLSNTPYETRTHTHLLTSTCIHTCTQKLNHMRISMTCMKLASSSYLQAISHESQITSLSGCKFTLCYFQNYFLFFFCLKSNTTIYNFMTSFGYTVRHSL